jgi:hypothetical protein
MRLGTHSCLECRKRKIRCIWPVESENCNGCAARKLKCVEQKYGDVPRDYIPRTKRMRQQIDEQECTIRQIVQRLDDLGLDRAEILRDIDLQLPPLSTSATSTSSIQLATSGLTDLAISEDLNADLEHAPLLALLDNDVLYSEKVSFGSNSASRVSSCRHSRVQGRHSRILRELGPLIPSAQAVTLLIGQNQLAMCLLEKSFPGIQSLGSNAFGTCQLDALRNGKLESFTSEDVVILTKILICLASCIQQLPKNVQFSSLGSSLSLQTLKARYMEVAEEFLAPDTGIVGSIGGLSCLLAQVAFYINAGLPRRAWAIFRRAVTFAYLLGVMHESPLKEQQDMHTRTLSLRLWQIDRSLSLILGLSYTVLEFPLKAGSGVDTSPVLPPMVLFRWKMGEITGRVIKRNSQSQATLSYPETLQMEHDLDRCREIVPESWWNAIPHSDMTLDAIYEMFTFKFWFHNLRNFIHMPFALGCSASPQHHFSVSTALEASREMIRFYTVLRDINRPVIKLCNMTDFQVLTGALIIILNLLGNSAGYQIEQQEQDWQVIDELIYLMNYATQDLANSVATQAARLLEDLSKLRHTFEGCEKTLQAVVPYFGKFKIIRRSSGPVIPAQPQTPTVSMTVSSQQSSVVSQAPVQPKENTSTSNPDVPLFNSNHYFEFESSLQWPEPDNGWSSRVDYTLLEDWSWNFGNSGII